MLEKGKISALQLGMLVFAMPGATALLIIPSITAKHAKQDLWLSPVWGSLSGFLMVYVACRLHKLYPNKTIVEYTELILGRVLGKIFVFVYVLFILHDNGTIIREFGEFLHDTFLIRTPILIVMGSITAVCAYAVSGGIEVVARCANVFLPLYIFLFLLVVVMLTPELNPVQLLPMLEKGIMPSFLGSIVTHAWFVGFSQISYLLPYVSDKKNSMKWGMIFVLILMIMMVITNLMTFSLYGQSTENYIFPVFNAATHISLINFLEHLDAIILVIWVTGGFIQISVFYYLIVLSTAQWLRLSSYRPVVLPVGFLLVLFSLWTSPSLQNMIYAFGTTVPFYFIFVAGVIPLFLLLIALAKSKVREKKK